MSPSNSGDPNWSPQQRRTLRRAGIGIMVVAAVMVIGSIVMIVQAMTSTHQLTPPDATADHSGITAFAGSAADTAPTVAVYLDYQCPDCAELQKSYGTTLADLAKAGKIQLSYHALTFFDQKVTNDSSAQAARGAACADVVGYFTDYQDAVLAAQPTTTGAGFSTDLLRDTIPDGLKMSGGARSTFEVCFDQGMTSEFVSAAALANYPLQVPRVMVNGTALTLQRGATPAEIEAAIQQAAQ